MLLGRYVHLTKAKPIHKRQTHLPRQRVCYTRAMTASVRLKIITGLEPQLAWYQDKLIGGIPPVLK
jgi:thiosulfate reductase cytochrome b subunit